MKNCGFFGSPCRLEKMNEQTNELTSYETGVTCPLKDPLKHVAQVIPRTTTTANSLKRGVGERNW